MTTTSRLAILLSLGLGLAACGGEDGAAGGHEGAQTETTTPDPEPEPPAVPEACTVDGEAQAVVDDPTFELRATATGPYTTGQEGHFGVALTPRGEYHVNQDFPMTIRPCAGEGVTLPDAELGNEDAAERTERAARFSVPFTAETAGEHRVSAVVDFAVCTPENCMPEQRTIALLLPVESPPAE
ncbi:MAG: hypothetical protein KC619_06320 [Myxococcales bacterium]|nr:hypothetical protein [Myxococcales bacterium]